MWESFENFQENALKIYFKKITDGKRYLQFVWKFPYVSSRKSQFNEGQTVLKTNITVIVSEINCE